MDPKYAVLQKVRNGKRTFGVTPHIPGGFIKANDMMKIAQIAEKYKGTLKITSGQRIAILGLEASDVDKVWEELGMEPGVKAPLSVKNVEMCPASFCKRAKQNSLKLGMTLNDKYHGMDMPNRTKIGVAGCRNSCTSVYSKDIGVIGDYDGYMVTVGGSGGFHPRVADIVIKDLTEEETLVMVETIVNYYKKEAIHGEKISDFINRISFEKFQRDVLNLFKSEK